MEGKNAKKYVIHLLAAVAVILLAAMLAVILVDPFFHYHKPWFGLQPVQSKKEFQVNGAIDHLDYDALLLGSSVTVNINTNAYDEAFGCHTLKACANAADPCTLCYFIDRAYQHQSLDYVFWGLDCGTLFDEVLEDPTSGQVLYLRDNNPFNDIEYLWNIDVLLKEVPNMIALSYLHDYDAGDAYEFTKYNSYNIETVLDFYQPEGEILPMKDPANAEEMANVSANVALIEQIVQAHPRTQFKFHLSLFSILWWDIHYRKGDVEQYLAAWEYAVKTLDAYDNVTFYTGVFNEPAYLMNLDLYCDYAHTDYETNQLQALSVIEGNRVITKDTVASELEQLRRQVYGFEERLAANDGNWEFLYEYVE
ncbi:MAG: hypothetical protein IJ600_01555 [Lachnospiraceae bacterium]|nr:hypothetical protein [Lachnospiraceae bacterium]